MGMWMDWPWWIRTTINGSKVRCPAVGRRARGPLQRPPMVDVTTATRNGSLGCLATTESRVSIAPGAAVRLRILMSSASCRPTAKLTRVWANATGAPIGRGIRATVCPTGSSPPVARSRGGHARKPASSASRACYSPRRYAPHHRSLRDSRWWRSNPALRRRDRPCSTRHPPGTS